MFPIEEVESSSKKEFGEYIVDDIEFISAEGEIVILQTFDESCPLQSGDVICKLDGVNVEDLIEHQKNTILFQQMRKSIIFLKQRSFVRMIQCWK